MRVSYLSSVTNLAQAFLNVVSPKIEYENIIFIFDIRNISTQQHDFTCSGELG
jgi:hypothetical protein